MDLLDILLDGPGIHPLFPVGVVAVDDLQGDRTPEGAPVAHPAGDLGSVALDLHAAAATVSELASRHVDVDVLRGELEPRGQPLDDAGEAGTVRLSGGDEVERHGSKLIWLRAQSLPR